jgi:hypothetical protein
MYVGLYWKDTIFWQYVIGMYRNHSHNMYKLWSDYPHHGNNMIHDVIENITMTIQKYIMSFDLSLQNDDLFNHHIRIFKIIITNQKMTNHINMVLRWNRYHILPLTMSCLINSQHITIGHLCTKTKTFKYHKIRT